MWVRGLKQTQSEQKCYLEQSHPMWVRGLKLKKPKNNEIGKKVAPHVGAWIETIETTKIRLLYIVAPHVGAWIETQRTRAQQRNFKSHPMWVRGLKLNIVTFADRLRSRTPCGCVD